MQAVERCWVNLLVPFLGIVLLRVWEMLFPCPPGRSGAEPGEQSELEGEWQGKHAAACTAVTGGLLVAFIHSSSSGSSPPSLS